MAADPANDAINRFLLGLVTGLQGMTNHDVTIVDDAIQRIREAMDAGELLPAAGMACLGEAFVARELSRLDLTDVDGWAAFTYQGR